MACCNLLTIQDKRFGKKYDVPCGFCLNCRVDRRNFLEDCCIHSENHFGTSAFVCLTYDDYHLPENASLRKSDYVDFIKRLRSYLNYHIDSIDTRFLNPNFDFLCVGEYGDTFNRPHLHLLFFGLDSRFLTPILDKCWNGGIVDCGALENGGIRYVLSYLEKNIKGALQKELYDDNGLERPFCSHSRSLCSRFIIDRLKEIQFNSGAYRTGKGSELRPIPQYWRKILCTSPFTNLYNASSKMKAHGKRFSLKEYNTFRQHQAKLRQNKLVNATRNMGYPVPDNLYSSNESYCRSSHKEWIKSAVDFGIYGDNIPF